MPKQSEIALDELAAPAQDEEVSGGPPPSRGRIDISWIGTLVLLGGLLFHDVMNLNCDVFLLDEGFAATTAERILRGEVIYRDFVSYSGPVALYALAGLFKVFGTKLLVGRWLLTGISLVIAALVVGIARRAGSNWLFAAAAAVLVSTWDWMITSPSSYNWVAQMMSLLALWLWVTGLSRPHPARWAALSGVAVSTAILSKHSIGLLAAAGVGAGIIAWGAVHRGAVVERLKRPLAAFAAAVLLPVLLVGAALLMSAGWGPVMQCLVHDPAQLYMRYGRIPYPDLYPVTPVNGGLGGALAALVSGRMHPLEQYDLAVKMWAYVPAVIHLLMLGTAAVIWKRVRKNSAPPVPGRTVEEQARAAVLAAVAVFAVFFHLQAWPRSGFSNIVQGVQPAFIGLAILLSIGWNFVRRRESPLPARAAVLTLVLAATGFLAWMISVGAERIRVRTQYAAVELGIRRADGLYTSTREAQELEKVIAVVQRLAAPGERIFAFPADAGLYFLAERPNATRYDVAHNVAFDPARYSELIETLEKTKPGAIIVNTEEWLDGHRVEDYAGPLLSYFDAQYIVVAKLSRYKIYAPRRP